jgi:sirohydrochlorin ferrochelatase
VTSVGPALLLVGHGSRSDAGVAEYWRLADAVQRARPGLLVGGGLIEFAEPELDTAIDALVGRGATSIVAVPLVLLAAGHLKDDGPAALARARRRHPQVHLDYARDLGVHPLVLAVAESRAREALGRLPRLGRPAVVLVGRGSSDPDANSDLHKIARLLADGRRLSHAGGDGRAPDAPAPLDSVEPAFVSLARPSLPETLERVALLGAREVAVVPYFLFTGLLVDRIGEQARQWGAAHKGATVAVGDHLGVDERLVELVLERYEEARTGGARMNCDCCVHRVALPGYEDRLGSPVPGA